MRGNASRFADKRESAASAKARLQMLLCGCTDAALAGFTPDHLANMHRVPVKECEYLLIIARQRRANQPGKVNL